ncbi:hypothetical protein [Asticcacaulis tiandongensis]|uniref:hypothetical protein n=1 Tax=Asticcacaulis tiandongensis TaxID=2565365 RepID=UPI00112B6AEB|nr:hypothetical protein [Asticcacaulis tiandongensis]
MNKIIKSVTFGLVVGLGALGSASHAANSSGAVPLNTAGQPLSSASAQVVQQAHVTVIESSYMPSLVAFMIDQAAGSCAAGSFLKWYGVGLEAADRRENAQAVYASLLTALAGNRTINLVVQDTDCTVTVMQIN